MNFEFLPEAEEEFREEGLDSLPLVWVLYSGALHLASEFCDFTLVGKYLVNEDTPELEKPRSNRRLKVPPQMVVAGFT